MAKEVPANEVEMGSLELTEELIRTRAYFYWEQRNYEHGHEVEDWLRAEAEVYGTKPSVSVEVKPAEVKPAELTRAAAA